MSVVLAVCVHLEFPNWWIEAIVSPLDWNGQCQTPARHNPEPTQTTASGEQRRLGDSPGVLCPSGQAYESQRGKYRC